MINKITLFAFCGLLGLFGLSSHFIDSSKSDFPSFNLYRTSVRASVSSDGMAAYTEFRVPADFKRGDLAILMVRFVSPDNSDKVLGQASQTYRIMANQSESEIGKKYELSLEGKLEMTGKKGTVSLLERLVMSKTTSFRYVENGSLTADVELAYPLMTGGTGRLVLTHAKFLSDSELTDDFKEVAVSTENNKSGKSIYDQLLEGHEERIEKPSKAKTNTTSVPNSEPELFDELLLDLAALTEKRTYDLFLVESGTPDTENPANIIQIGYYVPVKPKYGSIVRVLALKKNKETGTLLGHIEFDYYLKDRLPEEETGALSTTYPIVGVPKIKRKSGTTLYLSKKQESVINSASLITIMANQQKKVLVIKHAQGGSYGEYNSEVTF